METETVAKLDRIVSRELSHLEEKSQKTPLLLADVNRLAKLSRLFLDMREDSRKERYLVMRQKQLEANPQKQLDIQPYPVMRALTGSEVEELEKLGPN